MTKHTASELVALIERRHSDAIVVTECKDGPTTAGDGTHRRLDAWVLLKTWSPITCIGYEVKVSRSDWLGDQKFAAYLDLCHLLYIVAPKGIVNRDELPATVGLLEPIGEGEGQRLIMRKKAVRREITLPGQLMTYVLMSRTKITKPGHQRFDDPEDAKTQRAHFWREYAEGRSSLRSVGYSVKGRIRAEIKDAVERCEAAEKRARELQSAADALSELGITYVSDYPGHLKAQIVRVLTGNADSVVPMLNRLRLSIDNALSGLSAAIGEPKKPAA